MGINIFVRNVFYVFCRNKLFFLIVVFILLFL